MLHSSQYNNPSSSLNSEREKRGRGGEIERKRERWVELTCLLGFAECKIIFDSGYIR